MISIEKYKKGMDQMLWEVHYSAIRNVCIKDYSTEQVEAWAPKKPNMV